MKRLPVKAVLSSLLLLIFMFLALSGAMLYFGKTGMVLGMPRGALRGAHALVAALACVFVAAHFALNLRVYISELRALARRAPKGAQPGAKREKHK